MKTAIIFNPSAGGGRGGAIAAAVERGLVKRGLRVELVLATGYPKDAERIAAESATQMDVIVAVGGDGTINEIANGMAQAGERFTGVGSSTGAGTRATLGIIPAGTVNVLALELGVPFQVERACNVIAGGNTVSLDLGRVNDRRFVLMMGAGIDALTVRNIDMRAKKRFKELAFVSTGLRTGFARRPPVFLVRTGGREYRTTFFVAGNSRYYGGRFGITPRADPTDGMLDLMLFGGTTRSSLAVFWIGVPSGLHLRSRHVTYLREQRAELVPLEEKDVIWFQTDGELAGRLPATVEIDPHALDVLVP